MKIRIHPRIVMTWDVDMELDVPDDAGVQQIRLLANDELQKNLQYPSKYGDNQYNRRGVRAVVNAKTKLEKLDVK